MVVRGDRAVITRPGAVERRGEVSGVAAVVRGLGFQVSSIEGPATLDGGDVLKIGEIAYVGVGGRSSEDAGAQLAAGLGMAVETVPVAKVLHFLRHVRLEQE